MIRPPTANLVISLRVHPVIWLGLAQPECTAMHTWTEGSEPSDLRSTGTAGAVGHLRISSISSGVREGRRLTNSTICQISSGVFSYFQAGMPVQRMPLAMI
jgi:hypothetical protein